MKPTCTEVPLAIRLVAGMPGTTSRTVCPKCNGGTDGEKSLAVTVDDLGAITWVCFRASCGERSKGSARIVTQVARREPRHYTRPYKALNDDQAQIVYDRFGLDGNSVDGYSEADDRFILGVTSPDYKSRGCIAYSLSGGKPKSLTYNGRPDEPFVHHAPTNNARAVVVVEDWFSAEKVRAAGHYGIALMGTNFTLAMAAEIALAAHKRTIPTYVALDRDAYSKGVGYVAKYREQFRYGLYVWRLAKDLKYVSTQEIDKAVSDGIRAQFDSGIHTRQESI